MKNIILIVSIIFISACAGTPSDTGNYCPNSPLEFKGVVYSNLISEKTERDGTIIDILKNKDHSILFKDNLGNMYLTNPTKKRAYKVGESIHASGMLVRISQDSKCFFVINL